MTSRLRGRSLFLGWYLAAMAVVGVVAALLLAIIATARAILSNAHRALRVAREIERTTSPIWRLDDTNEAAGQLLERARAIEGHATVLADALARASVVD